MTYVQRDAEGAILTTYETAQFEGQELLAADDAELIAYQTARLEMDAAECAQAHEDHEVRRLLDAPPGYLVEWTRTQFPSLTLPERQRMTAIVKLLVIAARPAMRASPAPTAEVQPVSA